MNLFNFTINLFIIPFCFILAKTKSADIFGHWFQYFRTIDQRTITQNRIPSEGRGTVALLWWSKSRCIDRVVYFRTICMATQIKCII